MNEEIVRDAIVGSPLGRHLGMTLVEVEADRARLALPFAEHNVTIGDIVHGGAIVSLIDAAGTAAAWATDQLPENLRGTTVSLTVTFLAAARARELTADARVIRRGRSLCYLEVDVTDGATPVAKGLITYKLG
jgi:uncharacterized protein (TIGR00369 family)